MPQATYNQAIITADILTGWMRNDRKNNRAVLFVHGFKGDIRDTWKNDAATESFLELIVSDHTLDDYDVFTFGYKSDPLSSSSIDTVARQLESEIKNSLKDYQQIVLLAHSLGGLICMKFIVSTLSRGEQLRVLGLLMYGTPTTGVELIRIADLISVSTDFLLPPFLSSAVSLLFRNKSKLLAQMGPASEFLQQLHSQWILRVANGGHPTEEPNRRAWVEVRVVTGDEDWIVPQESAKGVYGDIDWRPIQSGHIMLVKPKDRTDIRYKHAHELLSRVRYIKNPEVSSKLREFSDYAWNLRDKKLIKGWEFELHLYYDEEQAPQTTLKDPDFAICEVRKCQYTTVLTGDPLVLGMTLGEIAADIAWQRNPAYLHQIGMQGLKGVERQSISRAIDSRLQSSPQAWSNFFQNEKLKIRSINTTEWFDLSPGFPEIGEGFVRKSYSLPQEASHLIGGEVELCMSFLTITPLCLPNFTVEFPWLTYQCDINLVVHARTDFLAISNNILPRAASGNVISEDQDMKRKVRIKRDDLILPDSSLTVRWQGISNTSNPKTETSQ